jgi:hypothetical protein
MGDIIADLDMEKDITEILHILDQIPQLSRRRLTKTGRYTVP